jgi:sulfite exporter TauE/SafE
MLRKNVGGVDRVLRVVAGAALIVAGVAMQTRVGWIVGAIGVVVLATGLVRWCWLYVPLGISTVRKKN